MGPDTVPDSSRWLQQCSCCCSSAADKYPGLLPAGAKAALLGLTVAALQAAPARADQVDTAVESATDIIKVGAVPLQLEHGLA
jgi:hypothetical protein